MRFQRVQARKEPSMMGHASLMLSLEAGAGLLQVQGQSGLHRELKANQGYRVRPCLKLTNKNTARDSDVRVGK